MLICPKNIEIIKKERSLNNEYVAFYGFRRISHLKFQNYLNQIVILLLKNIQQQFIIDQERL